MESRELESRDRSFRGEERQPREFDIEADLEGRQRLFDYIPRAIFVVGKEDKDFVLLDWNNAAQKISRKDISQVREKGLSKLLGSRTDIFNYVDECFEKKKTVSKEVKYVFRGDKQEKDLSCRFVYVPPDKVMILVEDITGYKKTEEALRQSEMKFLQVMENIDDVISIVDKNLKYVFISPSVESQRGYTVEECMNMSFEEFLTPASREKLKEEIGVDMEKGNVKEKVRYPTIVELEMMRKDGSRFWAEFHVSPFQESTGKSRGYISVCRDISDRKKAQKLLEYEKDRMRKIAQSAGAGITFISGDYKILWANRAVDKIFGNVTGSTCYESLFRRKEPCPECCVRDIFEKDAQRATCRQLGKDVRGSTVFTYIVATPVKDESGRIDSALVVIIPSYSAQVVRDQSNISEFEKAVERKLGEFESIKSDIFEFIMKSISGERMKIERSEKWLSLEEIAAYLGVKRDTIYKWLKRKKLPAHKVGGLWKFRMTEVNEWLESSRNE